MGSGQQDLMRLAGWRSRQMVGRYAASAADWGLAVAARPATLDELDLKRLAGWSSDVMLERYGASAADVRAREAAKRRQSRDSYERGQLHLP